MNRVSLKNHPEINNWLEAHNLLGYYRKPVNDRVEIFYNKNSTDAIKAIIHNKKVLAAARQKVADTQQEIALANPEESEQIKALQEFNQQAEEYELKRINLGELNQDKAGILAEEALGILSPIIEGL